MLGKMSQNAGYEYFMWLCTLSGTHTPDCRYYGLDLSVLETKTGARLIPPKSPQTAERAV